MSTPAYLGIDVSKGYADFVLLDQFKKPFEKSFQLDDNYSGHQSLENLFIYFKKQYDIDLFYCGLESTGGFENNWYEHLHELSKSDSIKVSRINPSVIKANTQATLNRNITDALSAHYIAGYLIDHAGEVDYEQGESNAYQAYRSLHRAIQLQVKQQTQLVNQLRQLLYSSFPELLIYCRNSIPQWVLELLTKYPSAQKVAHQTEKRLTKINRITSEKAIVLIEKARQSVASRTDDSYDYLIQQMAVQLIQMGTRIDSYKQQLSKKCKGDEITLLKSIPGFGDYMSAVTMIEIENINRFDSTKQLTCYFGIHPELKQSGDKLAYRMSKKGRPALRGLLYLAATTAIRCDQHLKAYYHHLRSKGKSHKQALGAIMHKLLRIVYGVLKSNTPYNATIDQKNIEKKEEQKSIEHQQQKETATKRRFQKLNTEAPVTRRQNQKRRVHLESQSEKSDKHEIIKNAPKVNL